MILCNGLHLVLLEGGGVSGQRMRLRRLCLNEPPPRGVPRNGAPPLKGGGTLTLLPLRGNWRAVAAGYRVGLFSPPPRPLGRPAPPSMGGPLQPPAEYRGPHAVCPPCGPGKLPCPPRILRAGQRPAFPPRKSCRAAQSAAERRRSVGACAPTLPPRAVDWLRPGAAAFFSVAQTWLADDAYLYAGYRRPGNPAPLTAFFFSQLDRCGRAELEGCGVPHFFFIARLAPCSTSSHPRRRTLFYAASARLTDGCVSAGHGVHFT